MHLRQDDAAAHQVVADVVQTGEKLVADRLTLLRHDVMKEVRQLGAQVALVALILMFGVSAFVAVSVGSALLLAEMLPAYQAVLYLGAGYGVMAAALGLLAKRRAQQAQQAEAP